MKINSNMFWKKEIKRKKKQNSYDNSNGDNGSVEKETEHMITSCELNVNKDRENKSLTESNQRVAHIHNERGKKEKKQQ